MKKIGIIGATGYAGVELLRLLLSRQDLEVAAISSVSFEGKPISQVYPNLYRICDSKLTDEDTVIETSDLIFASLPHGLSEKLAVKCVEKGKLLIDLGADFRFDREEDYTQWYQIAYSNQEVHHLAVYGLPELFRESIRKARIVGNPGCYPTSIGLGMAPALDAGLVETKGMVIDSKSGVTGAGRGLSQTSHFPDCNEAFSPYKVASHRHTPEIEQTLSKMAGHSVTVTFVPHLLPLNRGILSTIYSDLKTTLSLEEIYQLYCRFYQEEPFVRMQPLGSVANLRNVRCSNYCDISLHLDSRAGKLIVVSAIDNMVKGAAGQAMQNMNLLLGFQENAGLTMIPPAF